VFDECGGPLWQARSLPSGHNAACEGFFGLLKRERIYRMTYLTLDAARADVFEYIERRHNPRMRRRTARDDFKFSTLSQPSVVSGVNPSDDRECADGPGKRAKNQIKPSLVARNERSSLVRKALQSPMPPLLYANSAAF
jgi:hypothetical protein